MKTRHALLVGLLVSIVLLVSSSVQSSSVAEEALEFTLDRAVLKNVDDDAGRWQYSGGTVHQDGQYIANYASTKRVTFNTTPGQNTAALSLTLFFIGEQPPQSMTLQGTHDFHSGGQIGSVSAASSDYADYIGGSFVTDRDSLGSPRLTILRPEH